MLKREVVLSRGSSYYSGWRFYPFLIRAAD